MDATRLLTDQHREVTDLFALIENEDDPERKRQLAADLADALAIHMTIEERIFYPATNRARTEDRLLEAVEEHLAAKRTLKDLMETSPTAPQFRARAKVLKDLVDHHVEEEERDLFPTVRKLLGAEELESLGAQLESMAAELLAGRRAPRKQAIEETEKPAPIE